jgi:tetratricopeptide (TPR) repeat protein
MLTIKKKTKAAKQTQEQQLATISNKVSRVLTAYKKQAVTALAVLVALLVIAGGYSIMRASAERKASTLLAAAYKVYGLSGASTPNYGNALELYRGVQKKYPGTMSGAIAQYYVGSCLSAMGKPEEALEAYEFFVKKYAGDTLLLRLVYQRMGYVYITLGKQAEAIKAFEQAEALGGPGAATIELARLYERAGNKVESQKKYKLVEEKLGGTTWGIEAMGKVQVIKPAPQPAAEGEGK